MEKEKRKKMKKKDGKRVIIGKPTNRALYIEKIGQVRVRL